LYMILATLSLVILSTCPNQLSCLLESYNSEIFSLSLKEFWYWCVLP
jgi:hypothetical protein